MSKDDNGGSMCGGVVKESVFKADPMAYMMAWIMPDNYFKQYVAAKNKGDDKKAKQLFDKHAWSAI